jgi:hypothetical protein
MHGQNHIKKEEKDVLDGITIHRNKEDKIKSDPINVGTTWN